MAHLGSARLGGHCLAGQERVMKPYILGAICLWFACGITGAVMLGQQRVDVPTILGGPITLAHGFEQPVD